MITESTFRRPGDRVLDKELVAAVEKSNDGRVAIVLYDDSSSAIILHGVRQPVPNGNLLMTRQSTVLELINNSVFHAGLTKATTTLSLDQQRELGDLLIANADAWEALAEAH